jgi:hypothetical protein
MHPETAAESEEKEAVAVAVAEEEVIAVMVNRRTEIGTEKKLCWYLRRLVNRWIICQRI